MDAIDLVQLPRMTAVGALAFADQLVSCATRPGPARARPAWATILTVSRAVSVRLRWSCEARLTVRGETHGASLAGEAPCRAA